MNNVEGIVIEINNIEGSNIFEIDANELVVNNSKRIDKEIIDKLLSIMCLWKNEYGEKGIDYEEFIVKIYSENSIEQYHGKGVYPDNYEEFIKIVGELND